MVLSVVLVRLGWDELSRMQAAAQKPGEETLAEEDFKDRKNHIVIIGFGRVGEVVAAMCALCGLPYIVLDNDHQRVAKARTKDLPVFYGDAAKIQVLRSVGVERARAVVVAASNAKYATQIVHVLRHEWANVPLFGRARDSEHAKQLVEAGITAAVPITLQASLELGATVLQHLGLQPPDIQQIADNVRTGQGF